MRIFRSAVVATVMSLAVCAAAQTATPPSPAAAPAPASSTQADHVEAPGSLFADSWRQADFGLRWSSTSGDPARFQRYEDLGSGLLFTNARYAQERELYSFRATADNVGWRDQRFTAAYERPGRLRLSGSWDEIPQFYSVDTKTPYTASTPSVLVLDDNIQRSIQNTQPNLNAYV